HGVAVERPGAARVDEVGAAGLADVDVVRLVAEGDVAVIAGDRAAGEGCVAVVVVPGAVPVGGALVIVRVRPMRRQDHVIRVPVRRGRGVVEVRGGVDRLDAELVAGGR